VRVPFLHITLKSSNYGKN